MLIDSARVQFTQQHQLQQSERQLRVELINGQVARQQTPSASPPPLAIPTFTLPPSNHESHPTSLFSSTGDAQLLLMKALIEALIGREIAWANDQQLGQAASAPLPAPETTSSKTTNTQMPENTTRSQITLDLLDEYEYSEVSINADINTREGLSIQVSLSITMERHYQQSSLQALQAQGYLVDPLVINFGGDTVALSSQRTRFDLDNDGQTELIPTLTSQSAYIGLDKNNDGIINNGSELFGPGSGNGFQELAYYDDDHNGFIDANDRVFSQLLAFRPGDSQLQSLQSLGVNALYLGAVDSPFRLNDHNNQTLGQIRSTGFYLDNQGRAGSLQQIDLHSITPVEAFHITV